MDLASLIRTALRRWWLLLPVFLMTLGATVVFTLGQPRIYESSATLVVKPSATVSNDLLSALAIVSRQPEIAETFAQLATSRTILDDAAAALHLPAGQLTNLDLQSRVVPGTNLLRLSARSRDPALAQNYVNATADALLSYGKTIYGSFQLATVDGASLPQVPILPNVPLNYLLGAGIGVALAAGLAVVWDLIARSGGSVAPGSVPSEPASQREPYFIDRLGQEMSRTRRTSTPFTLVVIDPDPSNMHAMTDDDRVKALRVFGSTLKTSLRPEDVSARIGARTFGIVLPATTGDEAQQVVASLLVAQEAALGGRGRRTHMPAAVGLVEYRGEHTDEGALLDRARRSLRDADLPPIGKTQLTSQ